MSTETPNPKTAAKILDFSPGEVALCAELAKVKRNACYPLAVLAGIFESALVMENSEETGQAQLIMNLITGPVCVPVSLDDIGLFEEVVRVDSWAEPIPDVASSLKAWIAMVSCPHYFAAGNIEDIEEMAAEMVAVAKQHAQETAE